MSAAAELRGITWDHPRGYAGLVAATADYLAAHPGVQIRWERQPLAGFEATPVEHLAKRYDLIILDHPFMGDARASGCLIDLDEHGDALKLDGLRADVIGPSFEIYRLGGLWALPLDASTQMSAFRPDRVDEAPRTLDEVRALARRERLAIALHGPHALLTWFSIYSNLGAPPEGDAAELLEPARGIAALELLHEICALSAFEAMDWNSIAALEAMSLRDDLAYCPYVYGFATYSRRESGRRRLRFADVPALVPDAGCRGAMLGGTGVAISRRCAAVNEALRFAAYLTSTSGQERMAQEGGQPVRRSLWDSSPLDKAYDGFYHGTARTMQASAVRPRYPGYIRLQIQGGEMTERFLRERGQPRDLLDRINVLHRRIRFDERGAST